MVMNKNKNHIRSMERRLHLLYIAGSVNMRRWTLLVGIDVLKLYQYLASKICMCSRTLS